MSSNHKTSIASQRRSVLITGCSAGGLGEAFAFAFHANGLRVFATARNASSMQALDAAGIETSELDVTKTESVLAAREHIAELTGGKLDILVNNAGQSYPYAVADASLDRVKALFDVNFFGAFAMVQTFLPLLVASNGARILQIGSVAGVMPVPFGAAYNASKAALHSLGDTLRVELAPFNIKVITAVLGNVKTNIVSPTNRLPEGSLYSPIRDVYQSRRVDHFMDGAMAREDIARDLVAEVLKTSPRAWWWSGKNSWVAWLGSTFLSRRGFDWLLGHIFGINKLAYLLAHGRKNA